MSWTRCDDDERPTVLNPLRDPVDSPEVELLHEFYYAVTDSDLERLKRTITPELDLETLFGDDWDGYTALHLCTRYLDVFGFLLALGANPFALSYPGHEQPLHAAAARGQPEAVRLLLDLGADVNSSFAMYASVDPKPSTALWAALHTGNRVPFRDDGLQDWIGTIDVLASRGAEYPPSMQIYNSWSETYFEPINFHPHIPQAEDSLLLKALSSRSRVLWRSYLERRRGLSLSATVSDTPSDVPRDVQGLLEDFGRQDKKYNALYATSWPFDERLDSNWRRERVQMARILLDFRDQHDPRDKSLVTALCHFSANGNLELMDLVLEKGVDPNTTGREGVDALMATCGSPCVPFHVIKAAIELLVKHGANFHGRSRNGNTCLHRWSERRDPETLQYLLDAGADAGATNNGGETVFMKFADKIGYSARSTYQTTQENYAAFKMLVDAGSDIHATGHMGGNLLHRFCSSFHMLVLRASDREKTEAPFVSTREAILLCLEHLIRLGADPGIVDKEGKKPVDRFFCDPSRCREYLGDELAEFLGSNK